jgi:hypothetical protein
MGRKLRKQGRKTFNLACKQYLPHFPAPIAFVNTNFNLNENKSKDLKMSHKFRFWMAHFLMHQKFSAVQERCPPEKLFAIFHSPLFPTCRLADLTICR